MVRLRDDLNETVQLATLDGGDCLYLHVEESLRPMRLVSSVGARLSAHATGLGKALLSQLPPESLKERVASFDFERLTPNTISDPTTLAKAIDAARVAGFATDDEEYVSGCRCVAVPLRLGSGEPVALSVTMPSSRTSGMWPNDIHSALATAAEEIEKEVHI